MPKITKLKRCPICNSVNTDADGFGYEASLRKVSVGRWCEDCGASWRDDFEYTGSDDLADTNGDPATFPPDRIMP